MSAMRGTNERLCLSMLRLLIWTATILCLSFAAGETDEPCIEGIERAQDAADETSAFHASEEARVSHSL